MSKKSKNSFAINRRQLLASSFALGAVGTIKASEASEVAASNSPPNLPEWTTYLGDGVDVAPYGTPSEFESHVIRRNVPWLTATAESSVNFTPIQNLEGFVTPNGLCFERHHGGVAIINLSLIHI